MKNKESINGSSSLRFVKSKSFGNLPMPTDFLEKSKGNSVFTMLKERNSFDRNFPTLNNRKNKSSTLPPTNRPQQPLAFSIEKDLKDSK